MQHGELHSVSRNDARRKGRAEYTRVSRRSRGLRRGRGGGGSGRERGPRAPSARRKGSSHCERTRVSRP